jgi:hypothetical protein
LDPGGRPRGDGANDEQAVRAMHAAEGDPGEDYFESFMSDYTDAWNREDVDAIEAFYHYPFFSYKEGRLESYLDPDEGREIDRGWIETNRREGPATWERISSTFQRLGRNSVLVTTHWVFRRPDGTAVWDFVDTFQICRFGNRWEFLNRTLHD